MVSEEGKRQGRQHSVDHGLRTALAEAGELPDAFARAFARLALEAAAQRFGADDPAEAQECLALLVRRGGRGAEIALRFADVLGIPHDADWGTGPSLALDTRSTKTARVNFDPDALNQLLRDAHWDPVESADDALRRQSQAEIVNEILAGGAVAASFTAAAAVLKAKLEATTQREKNRMDMEIERLRIASHERIAGLQARSGQPLPAAEADDGEPEA
ncbi:hypothetical protein [Streptomyces sp. SID9124]|uniref:hypothetical protein n=1 Tax=Streptomyces sp. SID9124 TaxID=2706108 RepID=UPI0013DFC920|nr:hypothetical protein [Streptomyces sp. SID9124]NED14580.1 hypothetical protein [Streptomyces sp. SID9124]